MFFLFKDGVFTPYLLIGIDNFPLPFLKPSRIIQIVLQEFEFGYEKII